MRSDASGSAMEASFKAEQTSGGESACQTDRNVDAVVRQRDLSTAVRSIWQTVHERVYEFTPQ